ncbi:iron uptake porin [Synechococcus sp. CS-1330]|nr:iron uptake porin [Synechococcus sp. CS-1330]
MNLSKKLLLALAGTGMMAPMAASAQELASLNGAAAINDYMQQQDVDRFRAWESKNQVTSVTQFSDVQPTDWAYQALSNLVEKYGCVAGYPNGTYKGGQAMTRFEAAALLNACLDRVTEVTDELQRLMDEFKTELAALTGRVTGLEKKVGKLEAQQFSTTTKLKGEVNMVLGGAPGFDTTRGGGDASKTAFNYDLRLNFDTSWTGKDLLKTRLRSGNFQSDPFGSSSSIFKLDKAENTRDNVIIDRLYYTFPVGKTVKLTAGAQVRNTEMLAFLPTAYKSEVLDVFGLAGAPGTYNKATGQGFGFVWKQDVKKGDPYLTFSANYVVSSEECGGDDDETRCGADSSAGIFDSGSGLNALVQLGYRGKNWGAALGYRYGTEGSRIRDGNFSNTLSAGETVNSVAVSAFWQPLEAGFIPSISLGYGYNGGQGGFEDSNSWTVAFQWDDAFAKGNAAGFAVGQPAVATGDNELDAFLYEIFYKFRVTDNISITPALFYGTKIRSNDGNDSWGGVIQTKFLF